MFRPELYQQTNSVPRRDTYESLEKIADQLKLQKGSCIMDLGCGDGSVTVTVLKKFLPHDFKKILGTDIGEQMVKYANEVHGDCRTSFSVWDMSSALPREFVGNFDLVFSSYAIHWVQEQENVFSNIFNMLMDNGKCFLVFLAYTPIYDVYRVLSKNPKWKHWLRNTEMFISPYQDLPDPAKRVRGIMAKIGFGKINVKCEEKTYYYEEQHFRNTMEAICPFKIPAEKHQDFMDDYMTAVRDIMIMTDVNGKSTVQINYTLLVIYGEKK